MAKLVAKVGSIKDKEGKDINPTQRSAGSGNSFQLVKPDYYLAVVDEIKFGEYRAAYKGFPSKSKDKKWTYWKLTPSIKLLNDNRTLINRQDIQIGVVDDGVFVRPDGDKEKSAIWTTAQYFLGALGLLGQDESGEFKLDFDPELVTGFVIKVRTAIGGYIKGETGFDEKQMHELLLAQNDGQEYEFEDVPALVDQWNEDNGYDDDDKKLKTKNIIVNFFAVDLAAIEENGFYLDEATGSVFVSEKDYDKYIQLKDLSDQNNTDPF